jgi:hypothetical protein
MNRFEFNSLDGEWGWKVNSERLGGMVDISAVRFDSNVPEVRQFYKDRRDMTDQEFMDKYGEPITKAGGALEDSYIFWKSNQVKLVTNTRPTNAPHVAMNLEPYPNWDRAPVPGSPEWAKWFGKSQAVYEDNPGKGEARPYYHGTVLPDMLADRYTSSNPDLWRTSLQPKQMNQFNPGLNRFKSFGTHFGTYRQSERFAAPAAGYLTKVFIKAENPLRMIDQASWGPERIIDQLLKMDPVPVDVEAIAEVKEFLRDSWDRHLKEIIDTDGNGPYTAPTNSEFEGEANAMLAKALEDAGYDSIVYKNRYEMSNRDGLYGLEFKYNRKMRDLKYLMPAILYEDEAEGLREFLWDRDNLPDEEFYDKYVDQVESVGGEIADSYILWHSNQAKEVTNTKPTKHANIRMNLIPSGSAIPLFSKKAMRKRDDWKDHLTIMHVEDFLNIIDDFDPDTSPKMAGAREIVKNAIDGKELIDHLPYLSIENSGGGYAKVFGHEGRHRAQALKEAGYYSMPVVLRSVDSGEGRSIRWSHINDKEDHNGYYYIPKGEFPEWLNPQSQSSGFPIKFPVNRDLTRVAGDLYEEMDTATGEQLTKSWQSYAANKMREIAPEQVDGPKIVDATAEFVDWWLNSKVTHLRAGGWGFKKGDPKIMYLGFAAPMRMGDKVPKMKPEIIIPKVMPGMDTTEKLQGTFINYPKPHIGRFSFDDSILLYSEIDEAREAGWKRAQEAERFAGTLPEKDRKKFPSYGRNAIPVIVSMQNPIIVAPGADLLDTIKDRTGVDLSDLRSTRYLLPEDEWDHAVAIDDEGDVWNKRFSLRDFLIENGGYDGILILGTETKYDYETNEETEHPVIRGAVITDGRQIKHWDNKKPTTVNRNIHMNLEPRDATPRMAIAPYTREEARKVKDKLSALVPATEDWKEAALLTYEGGMLKETSAMRRVEVFPEDITTPWRNIVNKASGLKTPKNKRQGYKKGLEEYRRAMFSTGTAAVTVNKHWFYLGTGEPIRLNAPGEKVIAITQDPDNTRVLNSMLVRFWSMPSKDQVEALKKIAGGPHAIVLDFADPRIAAPEAHSMPVFLLEPDAEQIEHAINVRAKAFYTGVNSPKFNWDIVPYESKGGMPAFSSSLFDKVEALKYKPDKPMGALQILSELGIKVDEATGAIKSNKGIKVEEIERTGFADYVLSRSGGKVTKSEMIAHLKAKGQIAKMEYPVRAQGMNMVPPWVNPLVRVSQQGVAQDDSSPGQAWKHGVPINAEDVGWTGWDIYPYTNQEKEWEIQSVRDWHDDSITQDVSNWAGNSAPDWEGKATYIRDNETGRIVRLVEPEDNRLNDTESMLHAIALQVADVANLNAPEMMEYLLPPKVAVKGSHGGDSPFDSDSPSIPSAILSAIKRGPDEYTDGTTILEELESHSTFDPTQISQVIDLLNEDWKNLSEEQRESIGYIYTDGSLPDRYERVTDEEIEGFWIVYANWNNLVPSDFDEFLEWYKAENDGEIPNKAVSAANGQVVELKFEEGDEFTEYSWQTKKENLPDDWKEVVEEKNSYTKYKLTKKGAEGKRKRALERLHGMMMRSRPVPLGVFVDEDEAKKYMSRQESKVANKDIDIDISEYIPYITEEAWEAWLQKSAEDWMDQNPDQWAMFLQEDDQGIGYKMYTQGEYGEYWVEDIHGNRVTHGMNNDDMFNDEDAASSAAVMDMMDEGLVDTEDQVEAIEAYNDNMLPGTWFTYEMIESRTDDVVDPHNFDHLFSEEQFDKSDARLLQEEGSILPDVDLDALYEGMEEGEYLDWYIIPGTTHYNDAIKTDLDNQINLGFLDKDRLPAAILSARYQVPLQRLLNAGIINPHPELVDVYTIPRTLFNAIEDEAPAAGRPMTMQEWFEGSLLNRDEEYNHDRIHNYIVQGTRPAPAINGQQPRVEDLVGLGFIVEVREEPSGEPVYMPSQYAANYVAPAGEPIGSEADRASASWESYTMKGGYNYMIHFLRMTKEMKAMTSTPNTPFINSTHFGSSSYRNAADIIAYIRHKDRTMTIPNQDFVGDIRRDIVSPSQVTNLDLMYIEEAQSDWMNAGFDNGFARPKEITEKINELRARMKEIEADRLGKQEHVRQLQERIDKSGDEDLRAQLREQAQEITATIHALEDEHRAIPGLVEPGARHAVPEHMAQGPDGHGGIDRCSPWHARPVDHAWHRSP